MLLLIMMNLYKVLTSIPLAVCEYPGVLYYSKTNREKFRLGMVPKRTMFSLIIIRATLNYIPFNASK